MNLQDFGYMHMAYSLAEKAVGRVSPNPYVGAVAVRRGVIVGTGYHDGPGKPHAEIVALAQAGRRAEGATVYVTLEPCVHWGRTPPCVDSLIQARLKRVVISDLDANPLVFKRGVRRLKQEGLPVECGLLSEKNRRLNEIYIKYITRKTPFVAVKSAISLDGRLATRTFDSRWISSAETREYVHLLRGEYDALMVGINTVLRDDPQLTIRHPRWKDKPLTRVVVDSRLRFPLEAKMLKTQDRGNIIVFTRPEASRRKAAALEKKGARVVSVPGKGPHVDLRAVLARLADIEIAALLVEGGGILVSSLFQARLADKVFLALSPKLIGGSTAPAFIAGAGVPRLSEALSLKDTRVFSLGSDIIVEGYI